MRYSLRTAQKLQGILENSSEKYKVPNENGADKYILFHAGRRRRSENKVLIEEHKRKMYMTPVE